MVESERDTSGVSAFVNCGGWFSLGELSRERNTRGTGSPAVESLPRQAPREDTLAVPRRCSFMRTLASDRYKGRESCPSPESTAAHQPGQEELWLPSEPSEVVGESRSLGSRKRRVEIFLVCCVGAGFGPTVLKQDLACPAVPPPRG